MSTGSQGQVFLQTAWCCCWESSCIALFSWCCLLWLGSLVHWLKNTPKALGSHHHVWQWGWCSLGWRLLHFYAKWRQHHCDQIIQFLFHLTITLKTRNLLLCPDEHLQRPNELLHALEVPGEVAFSLVCIRGTQQCPLDCLPWDIATSRAQIHQNGLGGDPWILFHLSHYSPGQHRFHFWLPTTSSEIFHSAEHLVFFNNTLHCSHWNLKTFGYGLVAHSSLVSSHNAQLQVLTEFLCLSHECPQTTCRELLFFTCWVDQNSYFQLIRVIRML